MGNKKSQIGEDSPKLENFRQRKLSKSDLGNSNKSSSDSILEEGDLKIREDLNIK